MEFPKYKDFVSAPNFSDYDNNTHNRFVDISKVFEKVQTFIGEPVTTLLEDEDRLVVLTKTYLINVSSITADAYIQVFLRSSILNVSVYPVPWSPIDHGKSHSVKLQFATGESFDLSIKAHYDPKDTEKLICPLIPNLSG